MSLMNKAEFTFPSLNLLFETSTIGYYMEHLRVVFSSVMPPGIDTANISIEIWDRDCNVWSDEDLPSDGEALTEETA